MVYDKSKNHEVIDLNSSTLRPYKFRIPHSTLVDISKVCILVNDHNLAELVIASGELKIDTFYCNKG